MKDLGRVLSDGIFIDYRPGIFKQRFWCVNKIEIKTSDGKSTVMPELNNI